MNKYSFKIFPKAEFLPLTFPHRWLLIYCLSKKNASVLG